MIILTIAAAIILATLVGNITFKKFKISFWLSSLIALAVCLLLGSISPMFAKETLIGNYFIQPWEILVIFFSVAYVATSVDATGLFEYFAFKITRLAQNTSQLFLFFFLLAGFITIFTSNDIVILTLTPIIIDLKNYANIKITPLLFAEFIAANTFSMFLYTGDPTNIIVANAGNFAFNEFAKFMLIPTTLAIVACFLAMRLVFHKELNHKIKLLKSKADMIKNRGDAVISAALLVTMLISLSLSDKLNIEIWQITLLFCLIALIKDIIFGLTKISEKSRPVRNVLKMPWKILPFVVFFFIYVNKLTETNMFHQLTNSLSTIKSPFLMTSILGSLSALFANSMNNQPATILMTSAAVHSGLISPEGTNPVVLAIVIATSVGATITLIGTLAGVMWQTILHNYGIEMTYRKYFMTAIKISPFALIAGLLGLYISISLFG